MSWWGPCQEGELEPLGIRGTGPRAGNRGASMEFTGFTAVGRVGAAPPVKSSATFRPADVEVGTKLPYLIRADPDPPPGPQWKYSIGESLFNKYTL